MQGQQINLDIQFIEILRQQILHFQSDTLPKINRSKMNLFFVGKSGGGKSTLLNGISDRKIIFQKDEGGCFVPNQKQSEMYFEIADDQSESKTKDPKAIQLCEAYQIWDLPGYQDSRSAQEDLKNLIIKKLIIDNSNISHIVIVLQECQLTGDKGGFLIDIINILSEDDIIPTLIISFANEDLEQEFIYEQLLKYISNNESILSQKGKVLLQKIVDQNRVQLFMEPVIINNDNYELSKENLQQLKNFIFQPHLFKKVSMKFLLLDDAKQLLKQLCFNLKNDLQKYENQILTELIKIWELRLTDFMEENKFKIKYLETKNQDLASQYSNQLKNIKILGQFIEEFNELEDEVLNIKQRVEKILTQEQIVKHVNILKIFCGQITVKRLKEIIKSYTDIDAIFIYSLISFQVDENFDSQGLSICIKTKHFRVASQTMMTINLSGRNGFILTESKASQNLNGKNGNNGLNGNNGQNGGNFILDSKEYVNIEKLLINLSGGNGSDGQDGGDGKDGENGCDAEQKSVNMQEQQCERHQQEIDYSYADRFTFNKTGHIEYFSRGTSGYIGGNAGKGGQGGLNGLKGQFKITNNQAPCLIIDNDGIKGKDGSDGKFGKGGINGKDYTRKLYDIKYEGLDMKYLDENVNNHQLVKGKEFQTKAKRLILALPTLGLVQNAGSIVQKYWRDGQWLSEGNFIDKGRAQDGIINSEFFQNQQEDQIQCNFKEQLQHFQMFIQNKKNENQGKIYNHLL